MSAHGEQRPAAEPEAASERHALSQFQTVVPSTPDREAQKLWAEVRSGAKLRSEPRPAVPDGSLLESGVSEIGVLSEAPPRTLHSVAILRSSPLSASVRAMIERREFARRYDALDVDLASIESELPALECSEAPVPYLASDASFEDLGLTVDCLLQHRKKLVAATIDPALPRRNVLVVGAGPGGLMAAIELRLRDHRVVVCEQREVYTRNRFIGVYKPVAHLMAALGMPERMTYDFTHYRGKRGIMLADIQTFLHAVALKLGVVLYTGTVLREPTLDGLRRGELELQRSTRPSGADEQGASAIGMTRWHHDTVARVRSGVTVRFDMILEATGGRSGLRELLVGRDNVVSLRVVGRDAARKDPSLDSYFDDPDDHCAQFVESNYGCPPSARRAFAQALLDESREIPDELPGLVSNVDASIITEPVEATARIPGVGARIGEKELDIPRDWVLVRCPLPDRTLTRYQIEGPLPQTFEFGGERIPTRECLSAVNPVTLLVRLLYAMGVPFEAVDRRRLVEFYTHENSQGDASDIVAAFVGAFRSLRLGGERPIWRGRVPGSESVEYAIIGEALQNAWYRFGVGVDDTFAGAGYFARGLELGEQGELQNSLRFEHVMISRSVQVLYHLHLVHQNTEQGVVGPVLTECYIDKRHRTDLAEARLRDEARDAHAIVRTLSELRAGEKSPLVEAAVEHRRDLCFRRVVAQFRAFDYDRRWLERGALALKLGGPDWRARTQAALSELLLPAHRELLTLLAEVEPPPKAADSSSKQERLVELAMGRYAWATPWVRATALYALDDAAAGAHGVLERAASDPEPLVAETAQAVLRGFRRLSGAPGVDERAPFITIDKVVLLKEVSIFKDLPHEEVADVAKLLTDVWVKPGTSVVEKGDLGDCLYVVASGRVRVHDGERALAHLGKKQFFGELSVLDAEPRSATVTAVEDTHLFRLGQSDFYALIGDRPEILHAVNHGLCQMVRGMLAG